MGAGGGGEGGQGMGGGFDSSGPAGLGADAFGGPGLSAAELAALDQEIFDTENMLAQVAPGKSGTGNLNVAPHVNVFELGQHEVPYSNLQMDIGPFLGKDNRNRNMALGLGAAAALAAAGLYATKDSNQKTFPGYGQPPSNPHAGLDADAFEGGVEQLNPWDSDRLGGVWQAHEEINKEVEQLNPWEAVIDSITPKQVTPGFGLGNLYDKEDWGRINENSVNPNGEGMGQYSAPTYNTNAVSNVVSRSLKEAAARKKTAARARAKAVVKEAARLKAKEEHRAKVLKDRAKVVVAKPTTRPNPVLTIRPTTPKPGRAITPKPVTSTTTTITPTTSKPAPLTDHQFNVRIREQTKARLARAREKTKAHYANLRKKGVSAKTIKLAQSKAKARYAKITAQGKAKYR